MVCQLWHVVECQLEHSGQDDHGGDHNEATVLVPTPRRQPDAVVAVIIVVVNFWLSFGALRWLDQDLIPVDRDSMDTALLIWLGRAVR